MPLRKSFQTHSEESIIHNNTRKMSKLHKNDYALSCSVAQNTNFKSSIDGEDFKITFFKSWFSFLSQKTLSIQVILRYRNKREVTLTAFWELGSPSSMSSKRIPPKPRWSCWSKSLSRDFLSFKLYLGLKAYFPSITSILGLLTSASKSDKISIY